ncbi:unnamed protein product [Didymodactylos carnosus]|uniref:Phage tail collar domain-containing protein n=1 Tax=Didymodactylos carnosus TaxID=1234261 RepID=A0A814FG22_9BILA|nr:unnamed protein product [Didymodactylos carnosus]CAF0985249.1 unnamed protein product [Didymodactylos carnosus]CAF3569407.1 unnamed protein product [Didymodactylos carnosus]CAF3757515.1 unnamed protein product [Didymodactylos carnosus]
MIDSRMAYIVSSVSTPVHGVNPFRAVHPNSLPMTFPTGNEKKSSTSSFLTGTVQIFASAIVPPLPWLLCNGTAVSRTEYRRLFFVIGTSYGNGDNSTTFNLPDFRGRFPLGVDESGTVNIDAGTVGLLGGVNVQQLSVEQLPSHKHDQGTLVATAAGDHSHSYYDPGHDHGGRTGEAKMAEGGLAMNRGGGGDDNQRHSHSISRDYTHITINSAGNHIHPIDGETGSVGGGQSFSLLSPYQTVNYIIYSD